MLLTSPQDSFNTQEVPPSPIRVWVVSEVVEIFNCLVDDMRMALLRIIDKEHAWLDHHDILVEVPEDPVVEQGRVDLRQVVRSNLS